MIQNSTAGKRFFGKHFWPGVAEYREGDHAMRILVNEDTIRKMNPTFEGKPVFVRHVEDIIGKPIDELKQEADGWVVRSFYNENDGATWAEFIVVSQKAIDAINAGWKLSNAYVKTESDNRGGLWNGVDFSETIINGIFEHLAIVNNPRYAESVILTPDEFKKYNEEKQAELRLQNSLKQEPQKLERKMPFNFFKKSKVENGIDLEGLSVMLPKTKREAALVDLINEADVEMKEIKDQVILVNEEKDERMTIEEAVKEINALRNKCNELEEKLKGKAENEDDKKDEDKKDNEDAKDEKKDNADGEPAKENECDKKNEDDKKDNEEDKKDEDKKDNASEEEKEKKLEETEKKTEELVKKNFLNDILNAKQVCANEVSHQDILLPGDLAELAKKLF